MKRALVKATILLWCCAETSVGQAQSGLVDEPYSALASQSHRGSGASARTILRAAWSKRGCLVTYDPSVLAECTGIAMNMRNLASPEGRQATDNLFSQLVARLERENPPEPYVSGASKMMIENEDFTAWCRDRRIDRIAGMRFVATVAAVFFLPAPADREFLSLAERCLAIHNVSLAEAAIGTLARANTSTARAKMDATIARYDSSHPAQASRMLMEYGNFTSDEPRKWARGKLAALGMAEEFDRKYK